MAKIIEMFKCDFCDRTFTTKKGAKIHEHKCEKNPVNNAKIMQRKNILNEISDIKDNAVSCEDLIQKIVKFWHKFGISIRFENYPNAYSISTSNSHNAPLGYGTNWGGELNKPRGYPGFKGSWKGEIEIIDKTKLPISFKNVEKVTMHDIQDYMPFIKTGSGGCGTGNSENISTFGYSGMLFIYDFANMHQQFKDSGGEYEVLKSDYIKKMKIYIKQFKEKRNDYIDNDKEYKKLWQYKLELSNFLKKINEAINLKTDFLVNVFNQKYGKKIPIPTNIFEDTNVIENITNECFYEADKNHPELKHLIDKLEDISSELKKYQEKNAELFI